MRMESDLMPVLEAVVDQRLRDVEIRWRPEPAVCVVMAAGGYPGAHDTGKPISGLADAAQVSDAMVFHAGTARAGDRIVTNGGRVLGVTALGADLPRAIERAYEVVGKIHWDGVHYRTDIGRKALNRRT
jgi:phosphoribosylamine--glycine ligase